MGPNLGVDRESGQRAQLGMRIPLLIGLVLLTACSGSARAPTVVPAAPPAGGAVLPPAPTLPEAPAPSAAAPSPALVAPAWPLAERVSPVAAEHAIVVSSHRIASEVGVDVLRRGGNAVDAAVAVGFALAVVHPVAGNIGGGGFMVIRMRDGIVRALDYREAAPARATAAMYVDSTGNALASSITGHLSVGVPGSVAGMFEAHHTLGRLPWKDLVAPAIQLARDGFLLDPVRSRQIEREADRLALFPASRAQFLVDSAAPSPGTRFRQPDLARTLQLIADSGPSVFYRGQVADLLVQEIRRGRGLVTKEDLAGYRVKWRAPIEIAYRGYTVYTMPPPSGGGVTLAEILNVMEGYAPTPPFGSATLMHLQAEAMRRAYADRNAYLGDPDFVHMPLERLLSKSYAAELRGGIDARHATPPVPAAAGPRVEGLLNDEMDDFTSAPGRPNLFGLVQGAANAIAPGKRMLSAMTPSIVLDPGGRLFMVLGSPGGSRIPTAVYQVLSDVIDQGMPLPAAIAAPRLHHQGLPDTVYLERDGFVQESIDSLSLMGHKVSAWNYKTEVNAVQRTDGGWVGVADPRRGGGAAGY